MILVLLENIWYQLWYMFCERTVGMSWYKLWKEHLISFMIWISHINHDMLENIWYLPWYMSVWEYLISAVIYQVCSVREHLIEIMIHFCKKTWYQPWYVFCLRISVISYDTCSVTECLISAMICVLLENIIY